jgi:transposase InsO family protein
MRRQGLQGRRPKHRKGLTRQDAKAPKFPDLVHRNFTAMAPNVRWCGDATEIPTDEGKLYLATVLDLFSRKLLACPTNAHPDAGLVCDAIKIATAVRGGRAAVDGSCFTASADRPTPQGVSPACASVSGYASRWAGSGRVSTMPPRRRSSPPWSTRCCPGTISPPGSGSRRRGRLVP